MLRGAPQPVVIRILNEDGKASEIARAHGMTGTFQLPPARYRVEAEVLGDVLPREVDGDRFPGLDRSTGNTRRPPDRGRETLPI